MPRAELAYNHAKNANIGYILFQLNCKYYLEMLYKENVNFFFKLKTVVKLLIKLRELIIIGYENLSYTQKS